MPVQLHSTSKAVRVCHDSKEKMISHATMLTGNRPFTPSALDEIRLKTVSLGWYLVETKVLFTFASKVNRCACRVSGAEVLFQLYVAESVLPVS